MHTAALAAVAVSTPAGRALAQQYPSYSNDSYRAGNFVSGGGINRQRSDRALFDHVRMDLDRAATYPVSGSDRKRFDEARRRARTCGNYVSTVNYGRTASAIGTALLRADADRRRAGRDPERACNLVVS